MKILEQKIDLWLITKLKKYENNSHKHSEEKITELAKMIKEFQVFNPIVIDEVDGILAGHARLEAAKYLKLKKVPVIVASHLSKSQKKAFVIADNQISKKSEFDEKILGKEMQEIKTLGFDLKLLAFDDSEIKRLLPDLEKKANALLKKDLSDKMYPSIGEPREKTFSKKSKNKPKHRCPKCHYKFD